MPQKKDIMLTIWFIIAIIQIHYSIFLFFNLTAFFYLTTGLVMMIEAFLAITIYAISSD
jgi:hypothetical protein